MSAFKAIKTQMKRIDCLVDALGKVNEGVFAGNVQKDESGQIHLQGYHGDDRSKLPKTNENYAPPCVIRIPRSAIGSSSNDIGVAVGADGNLELYVSDFDQGKYGTQFLKDVSQMYGIVEGVRDGIKEGAKPITELTSIAKVPGLMGNIKGVRMEMPKARIMQMA